jgi:hypothetical protein
MWTVLLLLGALAEGRTWLSQTKQKPKQARRAPPPGAGVSPLDDAVARTASVAAWFRGGPPPRHWTATLPNDYRGGASLGQGTFKKAFSVLNRTDVVLKTPVMHGGARQQTWAEVLYLEFLRGKAGVPKLHVAWREKRSVYYVVQRLSVPLVENSEPSAAWLKTCRARPLEAAVSLIEGVRSFADAGYFDAEHFLDGRKFALSEDGAVYLVDAPEPLATSPVRNVVDWALRGTWTDRNATKDRTCVADKDCPRLREQARGERVPGHKQAAREAGGWCRNGRCAGIDARAHVYDLATRAWALPLILAEGRFSSQKAKQRLEQLIKRMRSEAPEDRPSLFFFRCPHFLVESPGAAAYTKRRLPGEPTRRRRRDPPRNAGWRRYRRWTPSRRPRGPPSSPAKPRRSRAPRRRPPGPRARRRRGTGRSVQVPATTSAPSSARAPARKL